MERTGLAQRRPNKAPIPQQGTLHSGPELVTRDSQTKTSQALNVEEHCGSLTQCEAGPVQIKPNLPSGNPPSANLWQSVHSQPEGHPAGSRGPERRKFLRAGRIHQSQGLLERNDQRMEKPYQPRHEPSSLQQGKQGDDHV